MSHNTVTITQANFQSEVLQSKVPVVLDFWAPWCGPCRMIGPVLEELAESYAGQVKIGKLNVDEETELANQFSIRGIPTLLAFDGGQQVDQQVGFGGAPMLQSWVSKLLARGARAQAQA